MEYYRNRELRDSAINSKPLYFFKKIKAKVYGFIGNGKIIGEIYTTQEADRNNELRIVLKPQILVK